MWSDRCNIVPFIEINEVIHNDLVLVQVFCKLYSHTYTHILHFNCGYMECLFFWHATCSWTHTRTRSDGVYIRLVEEEPLACVQSALSEVPSWASGGLSILRAQQQQQQKNGAPVLNLRLQRYRRQCTCTWHVTWVRLAVCASVSLDTPWTYVLTLNDDDMHLTLVGWWYYVTGTFRAPGKFSGRWWMTIQTLISVFL